MKKISVITPSYNSSRFITDTIKSVQEQTYSNWEILITDDCSTDNTVQIVQEMQKEDSRIKLFQNKTNSGAAFSRNNSISQASGNYIAFLDSDDLWLPKKLELQIALMEESGCVLSYTNYYRFSDSFTELDMSRIVTSPSRLTYSQLLKTNYIGCLTAIYNADKLGKVYMPLIKKRHDYGLWLKILRDDKVALGLSEPLSLYRRDSGGSLSSNKLNAALWTWKLYRNVEQLSLIKSTFCFICYATRSLKRNRI